LSFASQAIRHQTPGSAEVSADETPRFDIPALSDNCWAQTPSQFDTKGDLVSFMIHPDECQLGSQGNH
jgi:hypothetical protein